MSENWQHQPQTQQGSPPLHDGAVQRSQGYGFGINVPVVPEVKSDKDQRAWLLKFHREQWAARLNAGRQQQMSTMHAARLVGDITHEQQKQMIQMAHEHKYDIDWGKLLKTIGILGVFAFLKWSCGGKSKGSYEDYDD